MPKLPETMASDQWYISFFKEIYLCIDTSFTAVSRLPLIHIENDCQHSCLWSKFTHLFPGDSEFGEEDNSWCESDGEPCDGSTTSGGDRELENGCISPVSERLYLNQFNCFNLNIDSHSLAHYPLGHFSRSFHC